MGLGLEEADRTADGRRLHGGDAAAAEVVEGELDVEEVGAAARLLEGVDDDLLLLARLRGHRHRVPHLHERVGSRGEG